MSTMGPETSLGSPHSLDPNPSKSLMNQRYHSEYLLEAHEARLLPFALSPFGRLPPEVRELIYGFVMMIEPCDSGDLPPWFAFLGSTQNDLHATLPSSAGIPGRNSKPQLALLSTCRQIYHEARNLYYSPKFFFFKKAESMVGLLLESGWANRRDLHCIRVFLYDGYSYRRSYQASRPLWEALAILSHCKFLRKLEIVIEGRWHNGAYVNPELKLPLEGLTDVDVHVRNPEKWFDNDGEQTPELVDEEHNWRLIRGDNSTFFQLEEEDAGSKHTGMRGSFHDLGAPIRRLRAGAYNSERYVNLVAPSTINEYSRLHSADIDYVVM